MNCMVKDGEKWSKCPDHINHDGEYGSYKCKWMTGHIPEHICTNPKYNSILEFTDEEFLV